MAARNLYCVWLDDDAEPALETRVKTEASTFARKAWNSRYYDCVTITCHRLFVPFEASGAHCIEWNRGE